MKTYRYLLYIILCVLCQSALAVTKNDVKVFVQKGQYEQAIEALNTLMRQSANSRDADCKKWLGQSYCMLGRYAEAVPHLEQAIKQKPKSGALWYLAICRQHLYDFEGAIEAIEEYLPSLHSEEWLERADSLLSECRIGERAFEHTLDVVVVDSMCVSKHDFFVHYRLGDESGKILPYETGVCFENQNGDHRIVPQGTGFAEFHSFQGQWDGPHVLEGVGSSVFHVLDPFLLADGETLYFACDSTPGIGGLDIYRTSFDAEVGRFYQPERLGMPFNSPFDDYMMAIDEVHQVGWWATERHAKPDSVTIYLFLMDDDMSPLDEPTVARARIDRISDSWGDVTDYSAFLDDLYNPKNITKEVPSAMRIIVAEGMVYDSPSQFKNEDAREAFLFSEKIKQRIAETEEQLLDDRYRFKESSRSERGQIASRILEEENELWGLRQLHSKLVKEYRRKEVLGQYLE